MSEGEDTPPYSGQLHSSLEDLSSYIPAPNLTSQKSVLFARGCDPDNITSSFNY